MINRDDAAAVLAFIAASELRLPRAQRMALAARLYSISDLIESPHTQREALAFIRTILGLRGGAPGCVAHTEGLDHDLRGQGHGRPRRGHATISASGSRWD